MRAAASNEAGAMTGFMGFGMAQQSGGANAQNLFAMGQQQQSQQSPQAGWTCSCGAQNTGKFCSNCGKPAPLTKCPNCGYEPQDTNNLPKFCPECGKPFQA